MVHTPAVVVLAVFAQIMFTGIGKVHDGGCLVQARAVVVVADPDRRVALKLARVVRAVGGVRAVADRGARRGQTADVR